MRTILLSTNLSHPHLMGKNFTTTRRRNRDGLDVTEMGNMMHGIFSPHCLGFFYYVS